MPMIFALRLSNSGFRRAIVPSSVVQTGVKSFGCENRTAQESPIQSWNLILPCVVSASKSGAVSLMAKPISAPLLAGTVLVARAVSVKARRHQLRDFAQMVPPVRHLLRAKDLA